METLVGLLGVVVGVLLNEYLRRGRRIEGYSLPVFERRLAAYAALMRLVDSLSSVAGDVLETNTYTAEERHAIVSAAVLEVADFCDRNQLFLDEELTVHCTTLLMGLEDVSDSKSQAGREFADHLFEQLRNAKRMIRESSGVSQVDRLFRRVAKPKLRSPVIDYYNRVRRMRDHQVSK